MALAARLRGPDIILRSAPPLSATTDEPLAPVPGPPVSASNHPDDHASGVPPEMSPQEQAAARAAARVDPTAPAEDAADKPAVTEPDAAKKPVEERAAKQPDDDVPKKMVVDGREIDLPVWAVREITKSRDKQRAAEAARTKAESDAQAAADRLAALEAELTEARTKAAQPETKTEQPPPDPRPTRDTFDDPDAYDEALASWAEREGARKVEAKIAEERAAAEREAREAAEAAAKAAREASIVQLNEQWAQRETAAKERYLDYDDVAKGDNHVVSEAMAVTIMVAPNGPDVAYWLGSNPEESARIAKLPTVAEQMFEIGRIAERLSSPTRARPRREAPIEPLQGSRADAGEEGDEPSMDEVANRVNKRYADKYRPFLQASGGPRAN